MVGWGMSSKWKAHAGFYLLNICVFQSQEMKSDKNKVKVHVDKYDWDCLNIHRGFYCSQLQRRAEHMKKSLEQQQKELEEKWKMFEKEKQQWEESVGGSKGSQENIKEWVVGQCF